MIRFDRRFFNKRLPINNISAKNDFMSGFWPEAGFVHRLFQKMDVSVYVTCEKQGVRIINVDCAVGGVVAGRGKHYPTFLIK